MKPLPLFTLGVALLVATASARAEVPYPQGYRDWHHVKSMVIQPGHALHASFGGIHHLYANGKAMKGYARNKFPDGSVIVFDLLEADDGGNALVEGKRKVVGVMHKDAHRYAATGGWGFEGFKGDTQERVVGSNAASACFGCHQPQRDRDYVFSAPRR